MELTLCCECKMVSSHSYVEVPRKQLKSPPKNYLFVCHQKWFPEYQLDLHGDAHLKTWFPRWPQTASKLLSINKTCKPPYNIHFIEVLICEKYDSDWWHFSADILIELFTKHTELAATVANPKIGWRWTSTKLSIQICGSLGICLVAKTFVLT